MSETGHRWDGEGVGIPAETVGTVEEQGVDRLKMDELAARREAESGARRYRFIAKAIPQILWTASPSGTLDSFNPRWTEYTGLTARRSLDRGWLGSLHPEDVRRWLEGGERAVSSGWCSSSSALSAVTIRGSSARARPTAVRSSALAASRIRSDKCSCRDLSS